VRSRGAASHDRGVSAALRVDMGTEWARFPIARLRYGRGSRSWALYWRDRNLRFHVYDRLAPSSGVEELLQEIGRDPTAIFWG
jgi:hypothetical protein